MQDLRKLYPRHLSCAPGNTVGDGTGDTAAAEVPVKEEEEQGAGSRCRGDAEALRLWRCGQGVYESIQNVIQVPPAR